MTRKLAPPPEAIVDDLLYPGEILIVAGAPGIGKTRFQLHLLSGLASGTTGWWGKLDPMKVLYCSQRSWVITSAQLRTVGIHELSDNFECFCPADLSKHDKSSFNSNPISYLENNIINKSDPPKLVVLDTLATYLPKNKEFNFNNYNDLLRGCDDIYYWAQHHKIAVSITHHTAKQKTDSKHEIATERVLGSQAIMAVAIGSVILEHYNPDDPTYIRSHLMSHLGMPESPLYFHGDDFRRVSLDEINTFGSITAESKARLGPTEQKVLDEIPFRFLDFLDILAICTSKFNIGKGPFYKIMNNLLGKGLITIETNEETGLLQAKRERKN